MPVTASRLRLLLLAALSLLTAACAKPITFQLQDATTGEPLPEVRIYRHSVSIFSLLPSKGDPRETDAEGLVVVDIPPRSTNLTLLRQGFEPMSVGGFRWVPGRQSGANGAGQPGATDPASDAASGAAGADGASGAGGAAGLPAQDSGAWNRCYCWDDLAPRIPVDLPMTPLRATDVDVLVVDPQGQPQAGVEVTAATFLYLPVPGLEREWGFPKVQVRKTGADGHCTLTEYSGFLNRFTARREGWQEARADLDGRVPGARCVELRMRPLRFRSVRYQVMTEKNRPIAGAVVSMGQARNGLPADPNAFKATTSADGFTPPLRIPDAEPLCIEVSAKGYVTRLDGPAWRVLDDGGVRRIVLERD